VCRPTSGASREYCVTSTSTALSLTGTTSWSNYSVQAAVRQPTAGNSRSAAVLGRVRDASHWYELSLKQVSGQRRWVLAERNGSSTATLAQGAYAWTTGTYYHLRLDMTGSTLTASVAVGSNGTFTTLGTATDTSYPSGRIGLRSAGTRASFDTVKVIQR
jgi:hypothetical protein